MNQFEQVSSDSHQMSLAGAGWFPMSHIWRRDRTRVPVPCPMSGEGFPCTERSHVLGVVGPGEGAYSEVQCIIVNGHVGAPVDRMMDRHG